MMATYKNEIIEIMRAIAERELDKEDSSLLSATYNSQRVLINQVFRTGEYNKGTIILRLTVIDSLYSTNAAYSYFSFDEMAERIAALGNEEEARNYFYSVALLGKDKKKLFCEEYGIQKNLAEGSKQMSLLSKYAYYCLLQVPQKYPLGFPIYDRLAKETYPIVCKMLGIVPIEKLPPLETPSIEKYVRCLNQLRQELFGPKTDLFNDYQQFDILDAYLWRMGKFNDGNMSLLVGWKEYEQFVRNIKLQIHKNEDAGNYKDRMMQQFAGTPAVTKNGFDFNKAVAIKLADKNSNPFAKLPREEYLNQLLKHWLLLN